MHLVGVEPTRPFGHQILSLTRMPVPPQVLLNNYINNKVNVIIFGLFYAVSGYKPTLCCLRQCYLVVLNRYHTVPTSQNCLMITRRAWD